MIVHAENFDLVTPFGGTRPGLSTIGPDSLAMRNHAALLGRDEDDDVYLRLGPSWQNTNQGTLILPKGIVTGEDEAVVTALAVSADYYTSSYRAVNLYLIHRWPGLLGTEDEGIRFGFAGANTLLLDVNRVQSGFLSTSAYALRFNLSGLTNVMWHALKMSTRTIGDDVYTTGWVHFNFTDLTAISWTKLFTLAHINGSSSVLYVNQYSGAPIVSLDVGNLNGLTLPCLAGRSGFGVGCDTAAIEAGSMTFAAAFSSYLG